MNLVRHVANWPSYLAMKLGRGADAHTFRTRSGLTIPVPRRLLHTFKEVFFDDQYFSHLSVDYDAPGLTVVDVGANVGYFSLFCHEVLNAPRVTAVEPMPTNFALLREYAEGHPGLDLQLVNAALSDRSGELELFHDAADAFTTSASVAASAAAAAGGSDRIVVRSVDLAAFLDERGIDRVDILKLDCEGAEYPILYGADDAVLDRIARITMEVHELDDERRNIVALAAHLEAKGFRVRTGEGRLLWAHR